MKFLVTGLTGFAAPHLAKLLLTEGHSVVGIIRGSNGRQMDLLDICTDEEITSIQWIYADLCDYASLLHALEATQLDGVFHLAAQSHPPTSFANPIGTYSSNVMGTVNLLSAVRETQPCECRFHFCSTSEVYGNACETQGVLTEDMLLTPCNPYGASKAAMDLYMQERISNKFIRGFVTRAFSHTGPRRGFNFSISSDAFQIAKMMLGLQDKTLLIGNLKTQRVVMDVRDCVRGYYDLMMSGASGVYNICGKDVHHMQHFTDLLVQHSRLENVVQQIHKPFYRDIDIAIQIGDTSRLEKQITWSPRYAVSETMYDLLYYWIRKLHTRDREE